MIPRTFPSTVDANGRRSMTIFPLTSYSLSGRWTDWIPVKGGGTAGKENTYAEDGGQVMTMLDSISGLMAWKDYVPVVFVDGPAEDAWDVGKVEVPDAKRGFVLAANGSDAPTAVFNFADNSFQTTGMTFTRSGDRTATVRDHNGIVKAVKANEIRMEGLRRVENLVVHSRTTSGWGLAAMSSNSGYSIGGVPAVSIIPSTVSTAHELWYNLNSTRIENTMGYWCLSAKVKAFGMSAIVLYIDDSGGLSCATSFNLTTGVATSTRTPHSSWSNVTSGSKQIGNGEWLIWISGEVTTVFASGSVGLRLMPDTVTAGYTGFGQPSAFSGNGTDGIVITDMQFERGVSIPSETVSIGVLSSPFHGYFADGVKYFTTTTPGSSTEIPAATRKGFLIEEQTNNSCLRSEEMDNASWIKTDTTITANAIISPSGNQSADLATQGVTGTSLFQQSITVAANVVHTVSCYLKRSNNDWELLLWSDAGVANYCGVWINLNTGALGNNGQVGSATYTTSSITSVGNGWYRVTLTGNLGGAITGGNIMLLSVDGNGSATRSNNAARYVWGAQLEQKGFVTSYVPTTSATVTRAFDVSQVSNASLPYNNTESTFFVRYYPLLSNPASNMPILLDSEGNVNNRWMLFGPSGANICASRLVAAGVAANPGNVAHNAVAFNKAAITGIVGTNTAVTLVNGTAGTTSSPAALPTEAAMVAGVQFGYQPAGLGTELALNGYIQEVRYYRQTFSSAKLQALTA